MIQLFLLSGYVLAIGTNRFWWNRAATTANTPVLPRNVKGILIVGGFELCLFFTIFFIAIWISKATREDLLLKWHGKIGPIIKGFGYSILLRIFVFIVLTAGTLTLIFVFKLPQETVLKLGKAMKPDIKNLLNPQALKDPTYLLVMITLMSFVVAGLREELWRIGMLSALKKLFPGFYNKQIGAMFFIALVAAVFGIGHLAQGWGGVLVTSVLGFGLGLIIWKSNSCWEAVLAHGFFDATSFVLLYFLSDHL
jgi:membrane protease YdiL (CAAX protease family)